jgi:cell division protein FtsI (penicillin-binding protein 3)
MLSFLEGVVQHGTGGPAAIPGVRVGGKTGTAQIYDWRTGGFLPNEYVMSFIAVAPIEAPRFVVLCRVTRPQYGSHGSDTALPTVRRVLAAALRLADDLGA